MTDTPSLHQLLHRSDLWQGAARTGPEQTGLATGFPALDRTLHIGGWPASGLTELLSAAPCPQALRLLLPALAGLPEGLIMLAAPPARPHTRTLRQAGLDPPWLLVMQGERPRILLRACHEAAASGSVAALIAWLPTGEQTPKNLRRLHLAAREGQCLLVLMRDRRQAEQPSPAPLRLSLTPTLPGDLDIRVIKQPGGWAGQRVRVAVLPEHLRLPAAAPADSRAPAASPGHARAADRPRHPGGHRRPRAAPPTRELPG